nr:thiol reductant ABC exporter subunit CydC [Ancylobacter koreensis]
MRLFFAGRRRALLSGIVLAALAFASGIALLGLAGWFITATAIAGASAASALAFDLFAPSAGIRFFALSRTATRYAERVVTHDATLAVLAALRERLFRGWAAAGAAGRLASRPTALLFRLTLDIDALDSLYLRVIVPAGAALIVTLGAAFVLALVDIRLGLGFALLVLTGGFAIPLWTARAARRLARRRAHALEVLRSRAVDLVAGQTELLMAGRLGTQRERLMQAEARLAQADDALNRIETRAGAALAILGWLVLALGVLAVAALSEAGSVEPAIAALVLLVVLTALDPFGLLRRGAVELERALIAARRLAPRLAEAVPGIAVNPPPAGLAVRLEGAEVRPEGAARPALSGLDLTVAAGERIGLVGASGAGKSTLIAALAGEVAATGGALEALPAAQLTQRTELFQDSLADNLRIAAPHADDAQLLAALAAAGLGEFLARLPEGLATRLGEGGLGLSGGQARRLALARLLLSDAPLWLLDEPTEGLDAVTADEVMGRLWARAAGRTVILATHLEREAAGVDRLAVLRDGRLERVVARGEPDFAGLLASLRAR